MRIKKITEGGTDKKQKFDRSIKLMIILRDRTDLILFCSKLWHCEKDTLKSESNTYLLNQILTWNHTDIY